jgi:hypothetical protein
VTEVEVAPMQDETILFHPSKKQFCLLNPTAAFVWECLEEPITADELADQVVGRFADVDGDRAKQDMQGALQQLRDLEFVEPV